MNTLEQDLDDAQRNAETSRQETATFQKKFDKLKVELEKERIKTSSPHKVSHILLPHCVQYILTGFIDFLVHCRLFYASQSYTAT